MSMAYPSLGEHTDIGRGEKKTGKPIKSRKPEKKPIKPIKFLEKPAFSVRFRFYNKKTKNRTETDKKPEKIEPNQKNRAKTEKTGKTEPNRFEPVFALKNLTETGRFDPV